ncbi:MAG: hypothetical protein KDC52_19110, partial [Ignavibacteriae bacterium]|nr:hypothetical protein [Ignavibacteriota bacterium]
MKNWTKPWMNRLASGLSRRDGREILHYAEKQGKNRSFLKRIKSTVNVIFKWGILEGIIPEAKITPVEGLEIEVKAS